MRKFFKNANTFGLIVILLAGGLVFSQSAFKSINPSHSDTYYYFNGADNSTMKIAGSWNAVLNTDKYSCGGNDETPCQIKVPADQSLEDYLLNHTNEQIITNSLSRRDVAH